MSAAPPPRPSRRVEAVARRLFLALAPRRGAAEAVAPPARFAPFELVRIPSSWRPSGLDATWFPALGARRGAVLLLPPWLSAGRAYFHRRGRIQALRAAGYSVLTVDLPGSGVSRGFLDLEVEDALAYLTRRAAGPLHLWGVSSGGYWAHPALARAGGMTGGFFEDVSPHLLEWSARTAPWGRPCYAFFRHALPGAYRFLDIRLHAPAMRLAASAYVSGGRDSGVRPDDTRALARAAGATCRIVPGAGHLGSIKRDRRAVVDLALATFALAELRAATTGDRQVPDYPSAARRSPSTNRSMSPVVL